MQHSQSPTSAYGLQTIPLQQAATLLGASCFANARPESTSSTNVYQTIDAPEKSSYLYPVESGYDSSGFYNNLASISNNNGKSFSNTVGGSCKYRANYQQHVQNQMMHQFQQLLESNNTNSRSFSSPRVCVDNKSRNRRLVKESRLCEMRRKVQVYCSWKLIALLLLFIVLNLCSFTVYLAGKLRAHGPRIP
jgi:hypothetical protein